MSSRSPPSTGKKKQQQRARLARNQARAEKERREAQSRLEADLRDEQDQIRLRRARTQRSEAVSNVSSPSLANARSALRQSIPRTGTTPAVATQDLSLAVSGLLDISNESQSQFIGAETEQQLRNRFDTQTQQRNLQGQLGAIDATPQASYNDVPFDESGNAITPGTRATLDSIDSLIDDLDGGTQRNLAAELDTTSRADSAAEINHGAVYDAVGDPGAGAAAAVGLGGDEEAHMDDYAGAYEELGGIIGTLLAGNDDEDFDLVESDESDDEAPTTTSTGVQATPASGDIDAIRRRKAVQMLRRSPGLIKLIQAGEYKFSDFVTNGALDMAKLTAVRNDIRDRIESTEESYTLAAKAKGYTPSGAAFPIEGVNNIVAGVRKIPGSKYVIYQGPQYVNG
jgi:hypothetical protein